MEPMFSIFGQNYPDKLKVKSINSELSRTIVVYFIQKSYQN